MTARLQRGYRRARRRLAGWAQEGVPAPAPQAPPLWHAWEEPRPALPSPSELVRSDPDRLLKRLKLPDASNLHDRGPQAALLEAAGRTELYELAIRDELPLPAAADRERYLGHDDIGYWLLGVGDAMWLLDVAKRHEIRLDGQTAVLDFGCSTGRVLRHLSSLVPGMQLRGVELNRSCVRWARANFPPALQIAQGSVIPSLPFPDGHFDIVYAGSVLTHIDEFEEAWLAELRRVLKPRGVAVLSFQPERLWTEMVADPAHFIRVHYLSTRTRMDPPGIAPLSPVAFRGKLPADRVVFTDLDRPAYKDLIHSHEWVRSRWGETFHISEIVERAHGNHQDAMIGTAQPR